MSRDRNYDSRYVYAIGCTWHDTIHKAGLTKPKTITVNGRDIHSNGLPCCPYCRSMLMEMPHIKAWIKSVEAHDSKFPGYKQFVAWSQGRCYPNIELALSRYNEDTGNNRTMDDFGFKEDTKES